MTTPAEKVAYAAKTPADWDNSVNPGEANDALDQLAERAKDLETAVPGGWADNQILRGDGTTAIQGSTPTINDSGDLSLGGNDLVNAGDVACDTISAAASGIAINDSLTTFSNITMLNATLFVQGASGVFKVASNSSAQFNGTTIEIDSDGDTTITADTDDTIDVAIGGTDSIEVTLDTIAGKDGTTPRTITVRGGDHTGTGNGADATFRAGDGSGITGDGGNLVFRPGNAGGGAGSKGTFQLQDGAGATKLVLTAAGALRVDASSLDLNSNTVDNPGNIDAKGDLMAGTADNAWDNLAVGSNGQFLMADSAESTGLKYARGYVHLPFGHPGTSTAATTYLRGPGNSLPGADGTGRGYTAIRAGSITGISGLIDINAYTDGDVRVDARVNGTIVFSATVSSPSAANGHTVQATQAIGTDTFSAGDKIDAVVTLTGTATLDDITAVVELALD